MTRVSSQMRTLHSLRLSLFLCVALLSATSLALLQKTIYVSSATSPNIWDGDCGDEAVTNCSDPTSPCSIRSFDFPPQSSPPPIICDVVFLGGSYADLAPTEWNFAATSTPGGSTLDFQLNLHFHNEVVGLLSLAVSMTESQGLFKKRNDEVSTAGTSNTAQSKSPTTHHNIRSMSHLQSSHTLPSIVHGAFNIKPWPNASSTATIANSKLTFINATRIEGLILKYATMQLRGPLEKTVDNCQIVAGSVAFDVLEGDVTFSNCEMRPSVGMSPLVIHQGSFTSPNYRPSLIVDTCDFINAGPFTVWGLTDHSRLVLRDVNLEMNPEIQLPSDALFAFPQQPLGSDINSSLIIENSNFTSSLGHGLPLATDACHFEIHGARVIGTSLRNKGVYLSDALHCTFSVRNSSFNRTLLEIHAGSVDLKGVEIFEPASALAFAQYPVPRITNITLESVHISDDSILAAASTTALTSAVVRIRAIRDFVVGIVLIAPNVTLSVDNIEITRQLITGNADPGRISAHRLGSAAAHSSKRYSGDTTHGLMDEKVSNTNRGDTGSTDRRDALLDHATSNPYPTWKFHSIGVDNVDIDMSDVGRFEYIASDPEKGIHNVSDYPIVAESIPAIHFVWPNETDPEVGEIYPIFDTLSNTSSAELEYARPLGSPFEFAPARDGTPSFRLVARTWETREPALCDPLPTPQFYCSDHGAFYDREEALVVTSLILGNPPVNVTIFGNLTVADSVTFIGTKTVLNVTGCATIPKLKLDLGNEESLPPTSTLYVVQSPDCDEMKPTIELIAAPPTAKECQSSKASRDTSKPKSNLNVLFTIDDSKCGGKKGRSKAWIAAIVVVVVVLLIVAILAGVIWRRTKKRVTTRVPTVK